MFHIVLYQPEIPPNTGNIMRLASNTGSRLSLIGPLGFTLEDAKLKRAGLDYPEWVNVKVYHTLDESLGDTSEDRIFAFSTRGTLRLDKVKFRFGDVLLFGPETRGLPECVRERFAKTCVRIPMQPESRSLNLSNAVSVAVFEAWRQQGFVGAK